MCAAKASGFVAMGVGMLTPFAALVQQVLYCGGTRAAKTARGGEFR